jgi:hypothetical protein
MQGLRRASFGYVSGLVLLGAMSVLTGCGGGDPGAGSATAETSGRAGSGGSATNGAGKSATDDSDAAGAADTANGTGAASNGTGGANNGAGGTSSAGSSSGTKSSGGSSGASKGGSSGASHGGSAGAATAGTSGGSDVMNEDYSVDSFGQKEPNGPDHPLQRVETKLLRRDEVSLLGAGNGGSGFGAALDDAGHDYAALAGGTGIAFVNDMQIFDTVSASLDDDGNDELVAVGLVGTKLTVRVVDSDQSGVFGSVEEFAIDDATYEHAWLRVGDFDQDGRDEILVAAVSSTGVVARIYDDALGKFALLKEVYAGAGEEIAPAVGNFDDDRAPELAFLIDAGNDLVLKVFDDADSDYATLKTLTNADTGLVAANGFRVSGLRLEAGNFDKDARSELIALADGIEASGDNPNEGLYLVGFDDAATDFAQLAALRHEYERSDTTDGYRYTNAWPWQSLVADGNGDGQDELFVLQRQTADDGLAWKARHLVFGKEADKWSSGEQVLTVRTDVHGGSTATLTPAAGRSDTPGADVIVAVHDDTELATFALESPITGAVRSVEVDALGTPTALSPSNKTVWATGGDFDADSLRIRYTGQKWLELTRPRPIVLLAAPPVKDGISQNASASGTAYGTTTSQSTDDTQEVGYTDSLTLSFEVSLPGLDFLTAGAQASMEQEFTATDTTTNTTSYTTSYASSYPDDVIVFNGTLCERYEYEVMGGGEPGLIGTKMTIDVPLDSRIYKWTVPYYNQSLGSEGSPIPAELLKHEVGDPSSYPSSDAIPANALWTSPSAESVGQGIGTNSASIDVGKESTTGASFSTSYSVGGSVGAFVKAEYSHAWNDTSSYSVTTGLDTTFQGTVGDIQDPNDYKQYLYSFGIFVYPAVLAGGEQLEVVEYWTEGLGQGYAAR